jgi:hypothetical protein
MKLAECQMGVLVAVKPDVLETDELRIGHVVGLAYAPRGAPPGTYAQTLIHKLKSPESFDLPVVVPLVRFAGNSDSVAISHEDLDLFTAF